MLHACNGAWCGLQKRRLPTYRPPGFHRIFNFRPICSAHGACAPGCPRRPVGALRPVGCLGACYCALCPRISVPIIFCCRGVVPAGCHCKGPAALSDEPRSFQCCSAVSAGCSCNGAAVPHGEHRQGPNATHMGGKTRLAPRRSAWRATPHFASHHFLLSRLRSGRLALQGASRPRR